MSGQEHNQPGDKQQKLVEAASLQLVRFLTGEIADAAELQYALQVLQAHAPQVLKRFPRQLLAQAAFAGNIHAYVVSLLPEYLDLGADAPRLLPDVDAHLVQCAECQKELAILQSVMARVEDWVALSEAVVVREPARAGAGFTGSIEQIGRTMIALAGTTWRWFDTQAQTLPGDLVEPEAVFGQWQLRRVSRTGATGRLAPIAHPIGITLTLPDDIARLEIDIVPDSIEQQDIWHITIRAVATTHTPPGFVIQVACGQDNRRLSGFRAITEARATDFKLTPAPAGHPYQLTVQYPAGGVLRTEQFDIPVVVSE